MLPDKAATATGYMRGIDDSGEDYLHPDDYFVSVELPQTAKGAWVAARSPAKRRSSPSKPLGQRCVERRAKRIRSIAKYAVGD